MSTYQALESSKVEGKVEKITVKDDEKPSSAAERTLPFSEGKFERNGITIVFEGKKYISYSGQYSEPDLFTDVLNGKITDYELVPQQSAKKEIMREGAEYLLIVRYYEYREKKEKIYYFCDLEKLDRENEERAAKMRETEEKEKNAPSNHFVSKEKTRQALKTLKVGKIEYGHVDYSLTVDGNHFKGTLYDRADLFVQIVEDIRKGTYDEAKMSEIWGEKRRGSCADYINYRCVKLVFPYKLHTTQKVLQINPRIHLSTEGGCVIL